MQVCEISIRILCLVCEFFDFSYNRDDSEWVGTSEQILQIPEMVVADSYPGSSVRFAFVSFPAKYRWEAPWNRKWLGVLAPSVLLYSENPDGIHEPK